MFSPWHTTGDVLTHIAGEALPPSMPISAVTSKLSGPLYSQVFLAENYFKKLCPDCPPQVEITIQRQGEQWSRRIVLQRGAVVGPFGRRCRCRCRCCPSLELFSQNWCLNSFQSGPSFDFAASSSQAVPQPTQRPSLPSHIPQQSLSLDAERARSRGESEKGGQQSGIGVKFSTDRHKNFVVKEVSA